MTQDTRKDPRAKVLTMTVRYKSATVDEFIEQYSLDISRGGIFIKTSSPFASGTLLKFEIRIAEDRTVLQGVGRVVWKRDPADAASSRPAGMGVKFIKLDDASRQVIEDLVTRHKDSGAVYESGLREGAAATADAGAEGADDGAPARKATMIGLGGLDAAAVIAAAQAEAAQASSGLEAPQESSFFPETNSEAEMPPPGERTVMRQAAELLQEALLGAGGTMAEVGATPLVDETGQGTGIELTKGGFPSVYPPPRSSASSQSLRAVPAEIPSMENVPEAPKAIEGDSDAEEAKADTERAPSERPTPATSPLATPSPVASPVPSPVAAEPARPSRSGGGNRGLVYLGLVAAAAAGIYFMLGGSNEPSNESAAPANVAAPSSPTPAEAPADDPKMAAEESTQAPDQAPSAAAAPAESAPAATPPTQPAVATVEKPAPAAPVEKPIVKPAAQERVAPAAPKPEPITAPKPPPAEKPAAPAAEKPAPAAEKPAPVEAAKPKPKPAAADDDNPY